MWKLGTIRRLYGSATAQQRNSAGNSFPSVPPDPAAVAIFRTPAAFYEGLPAIYHPLPGISEPLPRFTKPCPQLQSFCREITMPCREITEACRKITTPCRKITEACRELHNACREITRACREFHCLRPDLQEAADKPFTAIDAKERTERKKPSPVLSDTLSHRMGEGRGEGLNFQPATFN